MQSDDNCINCIYPLIELILSSAALLSCLIMVIIYYKSENFKLFSYTVQLYILLGTSLFTLLDFIFSVFYYSTKSCCNNIQSGQQTLETAICQITSYISVYGIMNVVSWQTVLIKITKEAILYKKQEQLSVHLNLIAFGFFFPIICTILPQLSSSVTDNQQTYNDSIYGLYNDVCWLQYNFTFDIISNCSNSSTQYYTQEKKQHDVRNFQRRIVTFSLLCFFLPVILQSIIQLSDLRSISKKIEVMRLNKQIYKGHENHIKTIKALRLVPYFFLLTCIVPAFLFLLEYFDIQVKDAIIFQVFKGLLSCLGFLIFVMFLQNAHIKLVVSQLVKMKEKSIYDFQIDLFSGLEEYDLKKSDITKQE